MKIVAISDTHTKHRQLGTLPEGDVLVHAGDSTYTGTLTELREFAQWMGEQPHQYKVAVAGNHDFGLAGPVARELLREAGVVYLQDEYTTIEGVLFYGSPWTPRFGNWAFMKERGEELREVWKQVPSGVDVLVTHGPPYGILDEAPRGEGKFENVGDKQLLLRMAKLNTRLHIFGHIHAGYGRLQAGAGLYVNAAVCDEDYEVRNKPQEVEL